jgi:hypothetical protein
MNEQENQRPATFRLQRLVDVSGVSGTGHIADGVRWPDGTATVRWRSDHPSTTNWDRGMESVEHINGHGGSTHVVWDNPLLIPPDLQQVQGRLENVLQGEVECWDYKPFMESVWASIRDIQPLIAEVAALRKELGR